MAEPVKDSPARRPARTKVSGGGAVAATATRAHVCIAACFFCAAAAAAQSSSARARAVSPAPDLAGFEARLESLRGELRIPGMSAAVASGGRIVWAKGFGYADAERRVPATPGWWVSLRLSSRARARDLEWSGRRDPSLRSG